MKNGYNPLSSYRKGRMDALAAMHEAMARGRWTAQRRASWLRAAVSFKEIDRDDAAYYRGWISILRSHLSGTFSSVPRSLAICDHCPMCEALAQEMASFVQYSSLVLSVLCVLILACVSPFMAILLLMAIEYGVMEMRAEPALLPMAREEGER